MHILLINTNPVISRLLALCTRDDSITLEEVDTIKDVGRNAYDIVFIDEMSYNDEALLLDTHIQSTQKVLFTNDTMDIGTFDLTLKKPFLPSQIIEIIDNFSEYKTVKETKDAMTSLPLVVEDNISTVPQVLDETEIEKIKVLLNMDDDVLPLETLSDDEIELRKIEVIKEQLIADGLEIVEEDNILNELSSEPLEVKSIKEKKKKKKKKSKKALPYSKIQLESIEEAIEVAIATLKKKKMKQLLKGKQVKIKVQIEGYN